MGVYNVDFIKARITAIAGHYGSGKSEISVNFALFLAQNLKSNQSKNESTPNFKEKRDITLFDLDIVNPYFRSRECEDLLTASGVRVTSSAEAFPDVDLPYMPPELAALFQDPLKTGVLDIGGDPAGARVLARYGTELNKHIEAGEAEFWCVINANRPMTKTKEEAVSYVKKIRDTAGAPITGLINNTHFFGETSPKDILRGAELVSDVSGELGIPVIFHAVRDDLLEDAIEEKRELPQAEHIVPTGESLAEKLSGYPGDIFPIKIFLKKPWER